MDLRDTATNFRLEYARLCQLTTTYGSPKKRPQQFQIHYEYINSLVTSISVLSLKPKENTIALVSLLRMLLESISVLYELANGDLDHKDRARFLNSYNKGKQYPASMSYRKLVTHLPSTDEDGGKTLKKLYDECSKATHFSKKSLDILNNVDDPVIALKWSKTLVETLTESYKQQSDKLEQLVSAKLQNKKQ